MYVMLSAKGSNPYHARPNPISWQNLDNLVSAYPGQHHAALSWRDPCSPPLVPCRADAIQALSGAVISPDCTSTPSCCACCPLGNS